jgi:hypothetical protein
MWNEILARVQTKLNRRVAKTREKALDHRAMDRQLEKARVAWFEPMADFRNAFGLVQLPIDPVLEERHLENCRVLPHREALLRQMPTGGKVAEIGVQTGRFSKAILDICRPAQLHLVDLALQRFDVPRIFKSQIDAGIVHLHEGDSSTIVRRFDDLSFDFIYIDADHSYQGVKRDLEAARTKIKDEGFLVFNDYTYWSPAECQRYGVIRAVNELCLAEDWEFSYFALEPMMYCDVALRRRVFTG